MIEVKNLGYFWLLINIVKYINFIIWVLKNISINNHSLTFTQNILQILFGDFFIDFPLLQTIKEP